MSQTKAQLVSGTTAQDLTVDNINTTSVNSGQTSGSKNLVINGAFQVVQRGTSNTTNGYGTVDRFRILYNGTDENPTQAQVDVASGTTPYTLGFRKAYRVQNGNQSGGAGGADYIIIRTILEAQDIANSGWNYLSSSSNITLSFWVKSSVAQTFYGNLVSYDGTPQNYAFETGSLTADTWTKITKTIPGNSNLTFDNNKEAGVRLNILPFFGASYTGSVTLNQWAAYSGSAQTPANTSTWYTTDNATFAITGVQLEIGSTATDFEHKSFTDDYLRCARYFQRLGGNRQYFAGRTSNNDGLFISPSCPVPMRNTPTISMSGSYELFSSSGQGSSSTTPVIDTYATDDFNQCFVGNVGLSGANGYCSDARTGTARIGNTIDFDAEL